MAENQIYVKWFTDSSEVTDLLQTFINRGHDLNSYFINITMSASSNGYKTFAVFYDKRFEDNKVSIHTFRVMGNRWDHSDLIPEVYRKTLKEEPKEEPKKEGSKEEALPDGVKTNEDGNVYVPVGGVVPYPFRSGPVEFHLECVEDNSFTCHGCDLKERDCSGMLCNVEDRKDDKNVVFKIIHRNTV